MEVHTTLHIRKQKRIKPPYFHVKESAGSAFAVHTPNF
jgi:hypothetical protein